MIKQLLKVWLVVLTGIGVMIGGWNVANRMQYIEHFSTQIEQMDGVEVGYNEPLNDENFVLHLKSDEKTIQLRFHFSQLERLMPVLKKAWTIMNGEKL